MGNLTEGYSTIWEALKPLDFDWEIVQMQLTHLLHRKSLLSLMIPEKALYGDMIRIPLDKLMSNVV